MPSRVLVGKSVLTMIIKYHLLGIIGEELFEVSARVFAFSLGRIETGKTVITNWKVVLMQNSRIIRMQKISLKSTRSAISNRIRV